MNTTLINNSLKYIEAHLCDEITPDLVAEYVGYSSFHFFRMFSDVVGSSLKHYITTRRIEHVLYEAKQGQTLIDLVFEYQFDTYSGFYKACKKRYGLAPKEMMKHIIIKRPSLYLYGKEKYPMLTEAKVKNILKNWSLDAGELEPVRVENGQKRKDQWDIGHQYRLTIANELNKVKQNIKITNALREKNIMTPEFVKTSGGQYYVESGQQFVFIKEILTYETMTIKAMITHSDRAYNLGEAAAKLHDMLVLLDDDKSDETNVYETCETWALPVVKQLELKMDQPLAESFYHEYHTNFSEVSKKLPKAIIHRNLHLDNIFYKDNALIGYGDFQLTQKDVRIFDLGYLSTSILAGMSEGERDDWPNIYRCLIEGYNHIQPLTQDETKSMKYVLYSIQMIFIAYFATQENLEDLAIKNYKLLKWLYKTLKD